MTTLGNPGAGGRTPSATSMKVSNMGNGEHDKDFGKEMAMQWGPDQVKDLISSLSDKIPDLLSSLSDVLYSKENAEKYGAAVAHFYKSMVDAGMAPDQAYELTQRYMSSLSPLASLAKVIGEHKPGEHVHVHENE